MDSSKIIHMLGLVPDGTFSIVGVQLVQWGRSLEFDVEYQTEQPDGTEDELVAFRLSFLDCREMKWRSYAHIALSEMGEIALSSELAEIALGQGNHRRDANLLATHFAVTISYGEIVIDYNAQRYQLGS